MEQANQKVPEDEEKVTNDRKGSKLKEEKTRSIIEVKALAKIFNNEVRAVDGITFTLDEGEI